MTPIIQISDVKSIVQSFILLDVLLWYACKPVYMLSIPNRDIVVPKIQWKKYHKLLPLFPLGKKE